MEPVTDSKSPAPTALVFAEGRMTLRPPPDWKWQERSFSEVTFHPHGEWAVMRAEVRTYDIPDDIASDNLGDYLSDPEMPANADFRVAGLSGRVFRFDTVSQGGNPLRIWQRQMILGDYLRVGTFTLQVRPERSGSPEYRDLSSEAERMVTTAEFASDILPADRIGPSKYLKTTTADDVIQMRVPTEWKRERQDGRTVFNSGDRNDPVLWLDWERLKELDEAKVRAKRPFGIADITKAPQRPDRMMDHESTATDTDGEEIRIFAWHRIVVRMGGIILAHFSLVVLERDVDKPETRALRDLIEREVKNAVIGYPGSGGMTTMLPARP